MTITPQNSSKHHKRKGPPSFQRLPAERAKKLKRDWVEKKRIKSIWRRQKEKQGLGVQAGGGQHWEAPMNPAKNGEPREDTVLSDKELDQVMNHEAPPATTSHAEPQPSGSNTRPKSRSSLHSQSDKPRWVQKVSLSETNRDSPRSRPSTGERRSPRGRGSMRGKGRQPDMRMKMGRLLEQIKRDHTSG